MAAPVMKIDPSRAYWTGSPERWKPTVVSRPCSESTASFPVFIRKKEPVP